MRAPRNFAGPQCRRLSSCAAPAGAKLRRFARDVRGAVSVYIALSLTALLGAAGLGFDVALWELERRVMQTAVDTAVLAAAHTKLGGGSSAEIQAAIDKSFAKNDFAIEPGDVLDVNTPPASGAYAGNSAGIEIVLQRQANMLLSSVLLDEPTTIGVRAVAGVVSVGKHCFLALDETADSAMLFTGTADAYINCGVASNSSSSRAIDVGGTAVLVADPAQAFGDILVHGTAQLITNRPPQPHSPRVTDPFGPDGRNLQVPIPQSCQPVPSFTKGVLNTMDPGHYCGPLSVQSSTVHFNPGTYVIYDGDFEIATHSVVTGDGVTFVLTGTSPATIGVFDMSSQSETNLTAPSSGEFQGILIFENPIAEPTAVHKANGGASSRLKGAIYTRNRQVHYNGGLSQTDNCLMIVARLITVNGNALIENNPDACAALNIDQIEQARIRMWE